MLLRRAALCRVVWRGVGSMTLSSISGWWGKRNRGGYFVLGGSKGMGGVRLNRRSIVSADLWENSERVMRSDRPYNMI